MSESLLDVTGERRGSSEPGGSRKAVVVPATLAVAVAIVLSAWGTFGDHFHSESLGEYAIVLGIIGAATALVFGWLVPRGLRKESAPLSALALSVLGFLSIAVFWSGLPPVLAMGGITLGLAGWNATRGSFVCRAAVVIGVVALAGDVAVCVQDLAS